MDLGLDGRVALVTAASRGLGLASARALSAEGARVLVASRDPDHLARASEELGPSCATSVADMNDPEVPARLVGDAVDRWGRLDVVVANNGGPPAGTALAVDDDALGAALEANLMASVRLVKAAAPHMAANRWGRVCCITSYSVVLPVRTLALSNVARAGLYAWARSAASELLADGITVNLACPGPHSTDRMKELGGTGPMGDPGRFGQVVAFLCSEPAAWITGTTVVVDGGGIATQG
ncbi:MAG TPA: SDR family oxidoreductase, partial [Acidimicrobiales bacterium]|nr:SDR family oxidoreductase [Acidimicrobiales bacterium]